MFSGTGLPCPCIGFEDFGKDAVGGQEQHRAPRRLHLRRQGRRRPGAARRRRPLLRLRLHQREHPVRGDRRPVVVRHDLLSNTNSAGIRNADGSLFQVGQPLPPNQLTNVSTPLPQPRRDAAAEAALHRPGQPRASPRRWARATRSRSTASTRTGQDLGTRPRAERAASTAAPRRFAGILPPDRAPRTSRVDIMERREPLQGHQLRRSRSAGTASCSSLASYTLSEAKSNASLRATDEFGDYNVARTPSTPSPSARISPTRTDARHRVTDQRHLERRAGASPSRPIFRYRSKTPYNVITGIDDNRDGANFDLPAGVETQSTPAAAPTSAARPAPREEVHARQPDPPRADRRGASTCSTTTNPGGYIGQHALGDVRPADGLRRRLPARRAARVPARGSGSSSRPHAVRVTAGGAFGPPFF